MWLPFCLFQEPLRFVLAAGIGTLLLVSLIVLRIYLASFFIIHYYSSGLGEGIWIELAMEVEVKNMYKRLKVCLDWLFRCLILKISHFGKIYSFWQSLKMSLWNMSLGKVYSFDEGICI